VNRKLAQDGASFYAGLIPCCSADCARAPALPQGACVASSRGITVRGWHACLADERACCTPVARFCAASRRRLLLKGLQQLNAAVLHASEAGSPDGDSCAEAGPREPRLGKRGRDPCDEDGMESVDDARIELIGR
jgi:hypothetical protein